jgi:hypothetical protein
MAYLIQIPLGASQETIQYEHKNLDVLKCSKLNKITVQYIQIFVRLRVIFNIK